MCRFFTYSLFFLALLASAHAEEIFPKWSLDPTKGAPVSGSNKNARGVVPSGWRDDSAWANAGIAYSFGSFEGTDFLHMAVERLDEGKAQLVAAFPQNLKKEPVRLNFKGRASRPVTVTLCIRDEGPPYKVWWSEDVRLGGAFASEEMEFEAGPLPRPAIFMVTVPVAASIDIAEIGFAPAPEQQSDSRLDGNLLRNSRLPLGLQAGMGVGREFSNSDDFTMVADDRPENVGPSGAPGFHVQSKNEIYWDGELFRIYSKQDPHTASVYIKGDGVLKLAVMEGAQKITERYFRIKEDKGWQRAEVKFQPMRTGQNHYLRFYCKGNIWLDGLMVNKGESARDFAGMGSAEVALALPEGEAADAGIQFEDEPAVLRYAISGQYPAGSALVGKVENAEGDVADLDRIILDQNGKVPAGSIEFGKIPAKALGAFRVEARVVDSSGTTVSPVAEAVIYRLKKPRFWGEFAPESHFGVHVLPSSRHIKMAKATGNNWVRLHNNGNQITSWALLEPEKGTRLWADSDLQRYRTGKMEVLGMLETAPKWASLWSETELGKSSNRGPGYFEMFFQPKNISEYGDYVEAVVSHYKGEIKAYEVWNEPWQVRWFGTHYVEHEGLKKIMTSEHPQEDYVALMKEAYSRVKAVNPATTVVGFNTSSNDSNRIEPEGVRSGQDWTAGVLAAGGQSYCDAASLHYYTGEMNGYSGDQASRVVDMAFGPNPKIPKRVPLPIWMTEGSSTVSGKIRSGLYKNVLPYKNSEDPLLNMEMVLRYDVSLLAAGVSKIFLYSMGDLQQGTAGTYRSIVNADGSLNPSAIGRATLAWHVDGLNFVKQFEAAKGVTVYLFEGKDHSSAVICPKAGHASFTTPSDQGIFVRDLSGNEMQQGSPIYEHTVFLTSKLNASDLEKLLNQTNQ